MIDKELTHIDLFSGIGGFTLAAEWAGFKTVIFCEKEKFCQKILQKRFGGTIANSTIRGLSKQRLRYKDKQSSQPTEGNREIPVIPEIRDFDGAKYRGATLLTGGFPCQPFSVAGQQRGKEDDRYLWPEMLRVINEAKPHWILAENVPGIFRMALDTVFADLEGEGYTTGTFIIPACGLNAPHRRNRVWIVANSIRAGTRNQDGKVDDQDGGVSQDRREGIRQKDRTIGTDRLTSTNQNACHSPSNRHQGRCEETRRAKREGKQGRVRESERANSNAPDSECNGWSINQGISSKDSTDMEKYFEFTPKNYNNPGWQENWHEVAARFCRVDDGISDRIHRLKALGNAIVPQIAFQILKNIAWIERHEN